jgi:hypothetical protein
MLLVKCLVSSKPLSLLVKRIVCHTHTNTHTPTDISAYEEDNISNGLRLHRHKTLTLEKLTYL